MNTSTTITNEATGAITRVTIVNHDHFNFYRLALAVLAFALVAWALRKIFWDTDSN
jgi:hypothetical protein